MRLQDRLFPQPWTRLARFRQINTGLTPHRDALEFSDGKVVLLTSLCKGQRETVLQLPASTPVKVEVQGNHVGELLTQ